MGPRFASDGPAGRVGCIPRDRRGWHRMGLRVTGGIEWARGPGRMIQQVASDWPAARAAAGAAARVAAAAMANVTAAPTAAATRRRGRRRERHQEFNQWCWQQRKQRRRCALAGNVAAAVAGASPAGNVARLPRR